MKTIDDRRHFPDAAILELQNGDAGGGIFIAGKIPVSGLRGITADRFHLFAHAQEQRVQGMATGREEAAAAGVFARVPAVLTIPGADAVIIIDLAVVDGPQQAAVDDGFNREELAGEAALEADTRFDFGLADGLLNGQAILPVQSEGLFDDQMLSRLGRGDGMAGVVLRIAADGDGMEAFISEHLRQIRVTRNRTAKAGADLRRIEFARGMDGGHLRPRRGVDGRDMGAAHPAITDNPDVIFLCRHANSAVH